ncbi:MAG: GH3 auxin-responsive promoter family protein [Planctomycetes bacterium]|nr:GH3 auxin-responsive promoter family protein [Planctomycetota bacterium]
MPTLLDHFAAGIARAHAARTLKRFLRLLRHANAAQERAAARAVAEVARSDFAKKHRLDRVRSTADLRNALPLQTFDDLRPYIDRVAAGETNALFSPGRRVLMLAKTSGTTARSKRIPVTPNFVADYRRGWNIFGLKMLHDHPAAILRAILQSSGRYDEEHTSGGIPCGAITGLLARTQKRIVRRYYVGKPEIAELADPRSRYYTLMRLGAARDVAFAITANPATLIRMAQVANEESETLIRDVRDGTVSPAIVCDDRKRRPLEAGLKPNPQRAAVLAGLRAKHGLLRPREFWKLEFLACWTGGSMGQYLDRLAEWYGDAPVRDIGLLASEGRVSIPLQDQTPTGVLDVQSAFFEFIPIEQCQATDPATLTADELEVGHDYIVVLSNTAGLLRYRLDDVVRVHGRLEQVPLIEFLYRAGRVASVAGEKLTENQVTTAVRTACQKVGIAEIDFVLGPCWDDPPHYRLSCPGPIPPEFSSAVDLALGAVNEEYSSRRKSFRLGDLQVRGLAADAITAMDRRLLARRGSTPEQYKRQCLFTKPGEDDSALGLAMDARA